MEPLLAEAEHEALCADEDAGRAEHEARKAEAVAAKLRDSAKARWATLAARQAEVEDLRRSLDAALADEALRFKASLDRASAVVKTWPLEAPKRLPALVRIDWAALANEIEALGTGKPRAVIVEVLVRAGMSTRANPEVVAWAAASGQGAA